MTSRVSGARQDSIVAPSPSASFKLGMMIEMAGVDMGQVCSVGRKGPRSKGKLLGAFRTSRVEMEPPGEPMKLSRSSVDPIWVGSSVLILGSLVVWVVLSRSFIYGEGHAERPILEFLAVYAVAWLAFSAAASRLTSQRRTRVSWILLVALVARILLIPSNLIQENDVYRYVLDGKTLLDGANPYQLSPLEVAGREERISKLDLDSPEAARVLGRIGYPEVPTVYPPAAQVVFALGALLSGWDWHGQRRVFLVLDFLVVGLIVALLAALERPLEWVLVYAWNPLVLKEIANSCHVDVLAAACILALLLILVRYERSPSTGRAALAGGLLGLAALSKIYPLVLAPVLGAYLIRRRGGWKDAATGFLACGVVVVAGYAPFLGIGWENLNRGLRIYGALWRMNEGLFSVAEAWLPNPRFATAVLIGAAALLIPWLRRDPSSLRFIRDGFWVLLVWFLLIPTPFPWYAVPLLAVGALSAETRRLVLLLSGALALYYLHFLYLYRDYPPVWWSVTRLIEHLSIWVGVVWMLFSTEMQRRRPPAVESAEAGSHSREITGIVSADDPES